MRDSKFVWSVLAALAALVLTHLLIHWVVFLDTHVCVKKSYGNCVMYVGKTPVFYRCEHCDEWKPK